MWSSTIAKSMVEYITFIVQIFHDWLHKHHIKCNTGGRGGGGVIYSLILIAPNDFGLVSKNSSHISNGILFDINLVDFHGHWTIEEGIRKFIMHGP